MTFNCPKCNQPLIYQPAAVHYWCSRCRLAFSLHKLLNPERA